MFERTMMILEQAIEERVAELKRDVFLGDADWHMVWRYEPSAFMPKRGGGYSQLYHTHTHLSARPCDMLVCPFRYVPVMTPEVYWHRITKNHLKLSSEEVDVMAWHVESERKPLGQDGKGGRRRTRARNLQALPYRLRPVWRG